MSGSWRVDQPGHDPQWFALEDDAKAAADLRTPTINAPVLVWFDAFDYDAHNPDDAARRRYERLIAHERSVGLAYVGTKLDDLCRRLGLPVTTWRTA